MRLFEIVQAALGVVPMIGAKVRGPGSSIRRVPPEYAGAVDYLTRSNPHGAVAHHALLRHLH